MKRKNGVGFFVVFDDVFKTRESTATFIEAIRKTRCAYHGDRCDCKYGANHLTTWGGESGNGCPELRVLRALILSMTDNEFERIKKRL